MEKEIEVWEDNGLLYTRTPFNHMFRREIKRLKVSTGERPDSRDIDTFLGADREKISAILLSVFGDDGKTTSKIDVKVELPPGYPHCIEGCFTIGNRRLSIDPKWSEDLYIGCVCVSRVQCADLGRHNYNTVAKFDRLSGGFVIDHAPNGRPFPRAILNEPTRLYLRGVTSDLSTWLTDVDGPRIISDEPSMETQGLRMLKSLLNGKSGDSRHLIGVLEMYSRIREGLVKFGESAKDAEEKAARIAFEFGAEKIR